jgi:hypothetical protein
LQFNGNDNVQGKNKCLLYFCTYLGLMKIIFTAVLFLASASLCIAGGIKKDLSSESTVNLRLGLLNDKPRYIPPERQGKSLAFGYFDFQSDLNNYLAANTSTHENFKPYYLGIGLENIGNNSKHSDVIGSFLYILPQTVSAGPNDSLELKMRGWHWTTSIFGWDFIQGETVALVLAPAISWGNLKMRRDENGRQTKYTNPFVAPGGRAELRFVIGNFMIGARATYRYDITYSLWKRKNDLMPVLPTYKNNGMAYFGYIGLIF